MMNDQTKQGMGLQKCETKTDVGHRRSRDPSFKERKVITSAGLRSDLKVSQRALRIRFDRIRF